MRITIEEVAGVKTRYYHGGSGQPLMLVHGVRMSSDTWFPSLGRLTRDFSACAPDLLDNGFTDGGSFHGGPPQPHMVGHLIARCGDWPHVEHPQRFGDDVAAFLQGAS